MNTMKKIISLCILCILIITLSGCKSTEGANDDIANPLFENEPASDVVASAVDDETADDKLDPPTEDESVGDEADAPAEDKPADDKADTTVEDEPADDKADTIVEDEPAVDKHIGDEDDVPNDVGCTGDIANPFSKFKPSDFASVKFYSGGGLGLNRKFESYEAVEETLKYLQSIPILYESVTQKKENDNKDFVLGGSEGIVFCNEKDDIMISIYSLYYGHESSHYGMKIGNMSVSGALFPDVDNVQYVVPSNYTETILKYIRSK